MPAHCAQPSRLFLSGATGFVGRNLCLAAAQSGIPIFAPVRDLEKLRRQIATDRLPEGLITPLPPDPSGWPDFSVNLAVLSAGVLFARNRKEYFDTNVSWMRRILAALPRDCKTVVLSSQSAGGPTPDSLSARNEAMPDSPITWYGDSKLAAEKMIATDFPARPITILRPPMILGARDSATLPLFQMARGFIRTKPGLATKHFSFLGVADVVGAIFAAARVSEAGPFYIASDRVISDIDLIETAARVSGGRGVTLRIPQPLVRLLSAVVDRVPAMRRATPSLTRDRAKEIWASRWVVDPTRFKKCSGWSAEVTLESALGEAFTFFQSEGKL